MAIRFVLFSFYRSVDDSSGSSAHTAMKSTDHQIRIALAALACVICVALSSCDRRSGQTAVGSPTQIRMSGGMNEWLSDGKMGLLVDRIYEDPTGPSTSPVTYFRVRFTVKNFTQIPVQLDHIVVDFTTADFAETLRAKFGENVAAQTKPFKNEINWARSLDDPRSASVLYTLQPLGAYQEETSGHFYFGKMKPACNFTFYRGAEIVAGPFNVSLGERVPQ
jgi:hypothetical protein